MKKNLLVCADGLTAQTVQPGAPGVRLHIASLLDSRSPAGSGSLAGESFAAVVEQHPRYPKLWAGRDDALFEQLDDVVTGFVDSIAEILQELDFDAGGIRSYRTAALAAFRAAWPAGLSGAS